MKLTNKDATKIFEMIKKYKVAMNLYDFNIVLHYEVLDEKDDGKLATTEVDIFENKFKIQLSKRFLEMNDYEKENIVIHELYHGLYLYYKMSARQCNSAEGYEYMEEMFINKITNIFQDWYQREDI